MGKLLVVGNDSETLSVKLAQALKEFDVDDVVLMEDRLEIGRLVKDITVEFSKIDDIRASAERLTAIRDTIVKCGISRPMMMACDPHGELVTGGICCSYEQLDDVPSMGPDAVDSVEALNIALEGVADKVSKIFASIATKIENLGTRIRRMFTSYEHNMSAVEATLKNVVVDDQIFSSKEILAFSKSDFDKIVTSCTAVCDLFDGTTFKQITDIAVDGSPDSYLKIWKIIAGMFSPIADDVANHIGFDVKVNEIGHSVRVQSLGLGHPKRKELLVETRSTVGELGWSTNDLTQAIATIRKLIDKLGGTRGIRNGLATFVRSLSSTYYDNRGVATRSFSSTPVRRINKLLNSLITLLSGVDNMTDKLVVSVTDLSKAAIKSAK